MLSHVESECTKIDVEKSFAESLDSEGEVNVMGLTFYPSRIWQEMDPTAFRCGVSDHAESMSDQWAEINGDYYECDEAESAKEEFLDGLRDELSHLESELEEFEAEGDAAGACETIQTQINAKQAEIDAVEAHSF
jgi:hypothetical protein